MARRGGVSEGAAKKEEKPRKFQAIRGTRDLLHPEAALWHRVEQTAHEVFATCGFGEIRLPIFESTELFARAVGGDTDIVAKEMYTFESSEASNLVVLRAYYLSAEYISDVDREDFDDFFEFAISVADAFNQGALPRTSENAKLVADFLTKSPQIIAAGKLQKSNAFWEFLKHFVRWIQLDA